MDRLDGIVEAGRCGGSFRFFCGVGAMASADGLMVW